MRSRQNQDGRPDAAYPGFISAVRPRAQNWIEDILAVPSGEILVTGRMQKDLMIGSVIYFAKYSATGLLLGESVLPRVGSTGFSGDTGMEVGLQSSGKIVFCGRKTSFTSPGSSSGAGFYTGRLRQDLSLDTSFGANGIELHENAITTDEQAFSVAVDAQDRIVVVGCSGNDWLVVRYLPNGGLDSSFGVDGVVKLTLGASGIARKLLIQPDGNILVAGHASNGSNQDVIMARLLCSPASVVMTVRNGITTNSPVITNGQIAPVIYGSARVGGTTVSKSFRVENSGTAPLTINKVTVPAGFRFSSEASTPSIAAGGTGRITVQMPTSLLGTFAGPVTIHSNDPSQGVFSFPITGQVVANSKPVYVPLTLLTVEGKPVSVTTDKLLRQVTDPNGDPIQITGFSAVSADGFPITEDKNTLIYTQTIPLAGTDSFAVTFSDGEAEVTGIVTVTVSSDPGLNLRNPPKIFTRADGTKAISFVGIAGRTYSIQQTTDGRNFIQLGTAVANRIGQVVFTTPTVPPPTAQFRIRQL